MQAHYPSKHLLAHCESFWDMPTILSNFEQLIGAILNNFEQFWAVFRASLTVSRLSTLLSLPSRSFPTELSPSYFPRFPLCPPCRRFHHASSFPNVHPVVASVSLPSRQSQLNENPSIGDAFGKKCGEWGKMGKVESTEKSVCQSIVLFLVVSFCFLCGVLWFCLVAVPALVFFCWFVCWWLYSRLCFLCVCFLLCFAGVLCWIFRWCACFVIVCVACLLLFLCLGAGLCWFVAGKKGKSDG